VIKKILRLKNVGLFADAVPAKQPIDLDKTTIIYAENGRGKSTLASTFRACSLGDSGRIKARKTIDAVNETEIDLLFQNGRHITFSETSSWNVSCPEIMIFDSEFVDQNIYSGFEVRSDQRQSLLEFALGDDAVQLKKNLDDITSAIDQETRKKTDIEKQLSGYLGPFELQGFIDLPPDEQVVGEIENIQHRIDAARYIQPILQRQLPKNIVSLCFDVDATSELLGRNIDDLAKESEKAVSSHLAKHNLSKLEDWISRGQNFILDNECPFCGQSLTGIELVQAYQSYFSQAYNDLKTEFAKLANNVNKQLGDSWIGLVEGNISTNAAHIDAWKDQVSITSPTVNINILKEQLNRFHQHITNLIERKQLQPLESVDTEGTDYGFREAISPINQQIAEYNAEIAVIIQKIVDYKKTLAEEKMPLLQTELKQLETIQKRQQPEVEEMIIVYKSVVAERSRLESEKVQIRTDLDNLMTTTLELYQNRVNELVAMFHAEFKIEKLTPNYRGTGNPRSDYGLCIRDKSIKLGKRDDVSNQHSFGTTLSEADKRTLAFAFFIARLERDPSINERIIILDDPVSSLDINRRRETINLIAGFANKCHQLIVLSHDAHFVRDLHNKLVDTYPVPIESKLLKIHRVTKGYSAFGDCDIDDICASPYYRHYRLISDYIEGSHTVNSRDIAKAIRPLLEGYLHRRFPRQIPRQTMFGKVIASARDAVPPNVLANLHSILDELRSINSFASNFHHDTNPDANTIVINDTELYSFAKKALDIIHRNG